MKVKLRQLDCSTYHLPAVVIGAMVIGLLTALVPFPAGGLILLLLVGLGIFLFLVKPMWALYSLIFLTPLISGMERGHLIPFFRPNEPLLLLAAVLVLISPNRRGRVLRLTKLHLGILVFLTFGSIVPLIVYLLRGNQVVFVDLIPLMAPWQYLLLYGVVVVSGVNSYQAKRCYQILILSGAVLAVVAILQAASFPPVIKVLRRFYYSAHLLRVLEWGYRRSTSLLANWHGTGVFLALNILTLFAYRLSGVSLFANGITNGLVLLLIAGIFTTASLTSFVVVMVGVTLLLVVSKRLRTKRAFVFISFILFALLISSSVFTGQITQRLEKQFGSRDSLIPKTILYRLNNWREQFLPIVREYWLFGYGPRLPADISAPSEDSQFVYMLLKGGVLYLIAFLLFMTVVIRRLWHLYQRSTDPQNRAVSLAAFSLFVAIIPACFLQAYMTYSGVVEYLWIVLGLSIAVQNKPKKLQ